MEKYMNKGIKEIIYEFPEIGNLLNKYGIGCVTCSVGTCMLKDIIEIHNLPEGQEIAVMKGIEAIIYPERKIEVQNYEAKREKVKTKEIKYSPPLRKLVDEHTIIKSFLALIPGICDAIETEPKIDSRLVLDSVDFIRTYADKYHHAKEEEILFKYVDENQDIVKVMLEDHSTARGIVASILRGFEGQDKLAISHNLREYKELLTQHIKKEDEILYPWIDRNLSITQVGEMFEKFGIADQAFDADMPEKYIRFVEILKQKM